MKFWTEREPREKILIGAALGLVALIIGSQFIVKPLMAYPDTQQVKLEQAERDLAEMKKGQVLLSGPTPVDKQIVNANQAQTMITNSAQQTGLVIARRQPNGETGLTVWIEDAESKLLYNWLDDVTGTYNVELLGANINRNDGGTVRAQLTFKLGT
ncbi:MAG: type II secretion system protein M [Acidimicrobiales bacterium]|nr:type II secretion system protein M [Hyphomonadaceae bacterium]RZV40921.1 MAG: type II secretion system protein M [Acidimicrobiales bacterium]